MAQNKPQNLQKLQISDLTAVFFIINRPNIQNVGGKSCKFSSLVNFTNFKMNLISFNLSKMAVINLKKATKTRLFPYSSNVQPNFIP